MPRNGSDVYSKPAGTTAVSGQVIESSKYNETIDDLVTDANNPRPVAVGGTGSANAEDARTALDVPGKSADETITGSWTVSAAIAAFQLLESDGTASHNTTRFIRNGDVFSIQTRNSGTSTVSDDYRITSNTSGGLTHEWRIANAEVMRVNSTGLGLGTTNPQQRLHIHEDSTGQLVLAMTNSTTGSGSNDGLHVGIDASENAFVFNKENTDLYFGANNTEFMRLSSAGLFSLQSGTGINEFSTDGTLAGNSDDAIPTEKAVKTYVDANTFEVFTSANQTITAAGSLTLAHGLGSEPVMVQAFLVCQTAEYGYSANDVVAMNPSENAAANASFGHSIEVDSTNLNIRFGASTGVYQILNKTSGAIQTITAANWRVKFKAVG